MDLDCIVVDFVADVKPHNGQDEVLVVMAPPGDLKRWLKLSVLSRKISGGSASEKELSEYANALCGKNKFVRHYEKGLLKSGMILGIEQKVSNYHMLKAKNDAITMHFFPKILDDYLHAYHNELFQ